MTMENDMIDDDRLYYIIRRCLSIARALDKAGLDIDNLDEINQVVLDGDKYYIAIPFRRGVFDRFDLLIPIDSI